jgi:hypothetical protein
MLPHQLLDHTPFDWERLPIIPLRAVRPACPAIPAVGCVDLEVAVAHVAIAQELCAPSHIITPQVVDFNTLPPAALLAAAAAAVI